MKLKITYKKYKTRDLTKKISIYNKLLDIKAGDAEGNIMSKMKDLDYGISLEYFKLTNFAVVKTYRLIQDHSWTPEGMVLDVKK